MRKLLLTVLTAAVTLSASAAVPFEKGKNPMRHRSVRATAATIPSRAAAEQTILDENFAGFSAGTETEPAAEIVYDNIYYIPASYTVKPGWTGQGVRPTGGSVSLHPWKDSYDDTRGGYISTPKLMMDGTATLTFKAKALGADGAELWVALCNDDYGPGDDQDDYTLTNEWKEFTLVASNGSLDMPSYFQFSSEEGIAMIDDVKIVFKQDRIASPSVNYAKNVSENEFVANWDEVAAAEGYMLTVLCTTAPTEVIEGTVKENFESINVNADGKTIDNTNPGYPEGWTISVSDNGSQDVTTESGNLSSGSVALMFDAVGDMIVTPATPEPIDRFTFWCKPTVDDDNYEAMSLIRVELYHSTTDTWENTAHLAYYNFPEYNGRLYTLDENSLGTDVTRVRLSYIQKGTPDFYIDDIELHYRNRGVTAPVLSDFKVNATEYAVKDIDPANDYFYFVKAYRDDVVSTASYMVWVDGVAGLKVKTDEAADVTKTSFTARWKQLGHADNYTVNLFRIVKPAADMQDVVVLEESFDKIDEGTVENPGTDWISPFDFGAKGWAATGWRATQPAWAAGMAGTTGTNSWMGTAGLVYTPDLDLSFYDGQGITIDATFVTTVASLQYTPEGASEPVTEDEGVFAMLMNSSNLNAPIASGLLETPTVGSNTGRILIRNIPADADLSKVVIAFMNKSGQKFFVDHAKIMMNVPAGKTMSAPLTSASTKETFHKFENLDPQSDHGYTVSGSTVHDYVTFASETSDMRIVNTSAGIDGIANDETAVIIRGNAGAIVVNAPDDMLTEVYSLTGIKVAEGRGSCTLSTPAGIYIVRVGSHTAKIAVR